MWEQLEAAGSQGEGWGWLTKECLCNQLAALLLLRCCAASFLAM